MSPSISRRKKGSCWCRVSWITLWFQLFLFSSLLLQTTSSFQLMFPEESSEEVSSSAISDPQSCKKGTRFHNETLGCWPLKKQGPCPPSMIFYAIDKKFGDCDCPDLYPGLDPVWVYDIASNQCFRTYQQAFCASGEWLTFDSQNNLACVPNRCSKLQKENEESILHPVVLFNDSCVRLKKPGEHESCPSPSEVIIDQMTGVPICSSDTVLSFSVANVRGLKCRPGTRRDRLGKCRPANSKVSFRPSSESS